MQKLVVLALAAIALAACASATNRDIQVASLRCQEVGITPSSVEYGLCTRAYMRQAHEATLQEDYDVLLDPNAYIWNRGRSWH